MRRIQTILATLALASFAIAADTAVAADPASPPAAANPTTPVVDGSKISKSRSNIQNNRQVTPPAKPADAAAGAQKSVLKTKTKSNQSND